MKNSHSDMTLLSSERCLTLYLKYFKIFGIEKYVMRFSTHDPSRLTSQRIGCEQN